MCLLQPFCSFFHLFLAELIICFVSELLIAAQGPHGLMKGEN